jgi:hypothetical protein
VKNKKKRSLREREVKLKGVKKDSNIYEIPSRVKVLWERDAAARLRSCVMIVYD